MSVERMTCPACGSAGALGYPDRYECGRCGKRSPRRLVPAAARAGLDEARRRVRDAREFKESSGRGRAAVSVPLRSVE